jgi:hypothetical protein
MYTAVVLCEGQSTANTLSAACISAKASVCQAGARQVGGQAQESHKSSAPATAYHATGQPSGKLHLLEAQTCEALPVHAVARRRVTALEPELCVTA